MTNTILENYNNLSALIEERKNFEAAHPYPPYNQYPTTIDFADVHGNTLLHYAAELGDVEKIKALLSQGAKLENSSRWYQESAFQIALRKGKLEATKYLFDQGADCRGILLSSVGYDCREWFKTKAREALREAFPDPQHEIRNVACDNHFFKKSETNAMPEKLAFSIGDAGFINEIIKGPSKKEFDKTINGIHNHKHNSDSLIAIAASSNQLEMVKFAKSLGAKLSGPQYTSNALCHAISNQDEEMIKYLLNADADMNAKNKAGLTALLVAVDSGDEELVKILIQKGARLDVTDLDGSNILHHAASHGSQAIIKVLQSVLPDVKTYIQQKNMYGFTPLDLAVQNDHRGAYDLLAPGKPTDDLPFGKKPAQINQSRYILKSFYYLTSHYRSTEWVEGGYCAGLGFLFGIYRSMDKTQEFYQIMAALSAWNGDQARLQSKIGSTKISLADFFEYWISVTTFLQNWLVQKFNGAQYQDNREHLWSQIGDKENPIHDIYSVEMPSSMPPRRKDQLVELIAYFTKLSPKLHFGFGSSTHATSAFQSLSNHKNKLEYYDANAYYPIAPVDDEKAMFDLIVRYQYKFLNQYYKDKMTFCMAAYYFKNEVSQLSQVFTDDELPKSVADAKAFQQKSKNLFTHLHVAVITGSFDNVQKIIDAKMVDLNAKDSMTFTAYEYAFCQKDERIIRALAATLDNDLTDHCFFLADHYRSGHRFALDNILQIPKVHGLERLLMAAIEKNDKALVERLVEQNAVEINVSAPCGVPNRKVSPLLFAYEKKHFDICVSLIKHGASLNGLVNGSDLSFDDFMQIKARLITVATEIDPSILPALLDDRKIMLDLISFAREKNNHFIFSNVVNANRGNRSILNYRDSQGFTQLHYAIMDHNLSRLSVLLKAGADVNAQTKNKSTPLIMALNSDAPNKIELVKMLLDANPNVHLEDARRNSAIGYVLEANDEKLTKLFEERDLIPHYSSIARCA